MNSCCDNTCDATTGQVLGMSIIFWCLIRYAGEDICAWIHAGSNIPSKLMLIIRCCLLDLQQGLVRFSRGSIKVINSCFPVSVPRIGHRVYSPQLSRIHYCATPNAIPMNYCGQSENKWHGLVGFFTTWSDTEITWQTHFVFHATPAILNNTRTWIWSSESQVLE